MTYYSDLSPYEYFSSTDIPKTVNIGWLDSRYDYTQGPVPDIFIERLWAFCNVKTMQTRGFHACDFCDMSWLEHPILKRGDEILRAGSAEIRVFDGQGTIYAAPDLIYHYVVEHQYRPPDEFIQAVIEGLQPDTEAYTDLIDQFELY